MSFNIIKIAFIVLGEGFQHASILKFTIIKLSFQFVGSFGRDFILIRLLYLVFNVLDFLSPMRKLKKNRNLRYPFSKNQK